MLYGPQYEPGLLNQQLPWYMEYGVRPLARAAKDVAVGTAGFGDLANIPVNAGLGLLGYQQLGSPSEQVGQYIDQLTGGLTAPRGTADQIGDLIGSIIAPGPVIGGASNAARAIKSASKDTKAIVGNQFQPLSSKYGNQYLTNDEYTKLRELNLDPKNADLVNHELAVAKLKSEKNYSDWQARLYQNLGEAQQGLEDSGHGLLAQIPEAGQGLLKALTYPARKETTVAHGLDDKSLRDRLRNAPSLDTQISEKVPGTPYNFQVPVTGKININHAASIDKVVKAAGPDDSIELLIDSPGGNGHVGEHIYNSLINSPAKVNSTIVGNAQSAAKLIASAGQKGEVSNKGLLMEHLANVSDPTFKEYNLVREYPKEWFGPQAKAGTIIGTNKTLGVGRWQDFKNNQDIHMSGPIYKSQPSGNFKPIPEDLYFENIAKNIEEKKIVNNKVGLAADKAAFIKNYKKERGEEPDATTLKYFDQYANEDILNGSYHGYGGAVNTSREAKNVKKPYESMWDKVMGPIEANRNATNAVRTTYNQLNPLYLKDGNKYLTNDEYTKLRELNLDPKNADLVNHELAVAKLKSEKNYSDWQARLYQNLGEAQQGLEGSGHGLLAQIPEAGQGLLKALTYPGRKDTTIEHGLYDRSLRDRLKNAPSLDQQISEKVPGTPYNFQVPITGGIGAGTSRSLKKIVNAAAPEDTIELLMDSHGGFAEDGEKVYNTLVNSPAKIKTTIVGKVASAANLIASAGKAKNMEAGHDTYTMIHHPSFANPTDQNTASQIYSEAQYALPSIQMQKHIGLDQAVGSGRWQDLKDPKAILNIAGPIYKDSPITNHLSIPKNLSLEPHYVGLYKAQMLQNAKQYYKNSDIANYPDGYLIHKYYLDVVHGSPKNKLYKKYLSKM